MLNIIMQRQYTDSEHSCGPSP